MAEIITNDKPRLLSKCFGKVFNNIVLLFKNQLVQAVRCIAWRRPLFLIEALVAKQIFEFFLIFILFITIVLFMFPIITSFVWCSKSLLG